MLKTLDESDVLRILDKYSIDYVTVGKNVSIGFVGVNCPYCDDPSEHCGIRLESGIFSCWRCESKGSLYKLINKLVGVSFDSFKETVGDGIDYSIPILEQLSNRSKTDSMPDELEEAILPIGAIKIDSASVSPLLRKFMDSRKINLNTCIRYNCYYAKVGDFAHRFIVPIYFNGMVVSYLGRDMTGKSDMKVKNTRGYKINNFIYNFDKIKKTMILTEGFLDSWAVGDNGVALFGKNITKNQKELILSKDIENLIFALDGDTMWSTKKIAREYVPYIDNVYVCTFPKSHDPDSYRKSFGYNKLDELIKNAEKIM